MVAGSDRVDANPFRSETVRQCACQAQNAGLARAIGGNAVVGEIAQHRSKIDDRAFGARKQRPRRHRKAHDAVQIDVHNVEEAFFLIFAFRLRDAGRIDEHVKPRKSADKSVDRLAITHVEALEVDTLGSGVRAGCVETLTRGPRGGNVRAQTCEGLRHAESDAARPAGDQNALAGEKVRSERGEDFVHGVDSFFWIERCDRDRSSTCGACWGGERVKIVVELVEYRLHARVGFGPNRIGRDFVNMADIGANGVFDVGKAPHGRRRHGRAADDAAFKFLRHDDWHPVDARLDLKPQRGLGPAARSDHPLQLSPGGALHDAQMARGGERDALKDGAMQMVEAVRSA